MLPESTQNSSVRIRLFHWLLIKFLMIGNQKHACVRFNGVCVMCQLWLRVNCDGVPDMSAFIVCLYVNFWWRLWHVSFHCVSDVSAAMACLTCQLFMASVTCQLQWRAWRVNFWCVYVGRVSSYDVSDESPFIVRHYSQVQHILMYMYIKGISNTPKAKTTDSTLSVFSAVLLYHSSINNTHTCTSVHALNKTDITH